MVYILKSEQMTKKKFNIDSILIGINLKIDAITSTLETTKDKTLRYYFLKQLKELEHEKTKISYQK